MIIGLTGTNASGKTLIVNYLIDNGFEYHSCSDIIRDELTNRGLEHSRDNLRKIGNELREQFGPAVLAERVIQKINSADVVIDSIRNVYEVKTFRRLNGFTLIAMDAPVDIRFQRSVERGRIENASDLETFIQLEEKEKSKNKTAQNIDQCMAMADYTLINDTTVDDAIQKFEYILNEIRKQ